MIRVAVVDDHPVVTEGFASSFERVEDIDVVWTASTFAEARERLDAAVETDVVLVDVRLPDGYGIDLLPSVRTAKPAYIVISSFDRAMYAATAFERGAAGFLLKVAPIEQIVAAIRTVARGGLAFDARHLDLRRRGELLTTREIAMVRLVAQGRTNDEVGHELGISIKTVESTLTRVYARYGFMSRAELSAWAEREGWLDQGAR